jgi:bifunctional DNase/RNase
MTHDLMRDLLTELGATVDCVVITELRESTFFAEIRMTLGGQNHTVSARPSDAIALAARLGTTIYAEDALLDAEGVVLQSEDEPEPTPDQDELVVQFREFIEGVRPEDFSS